MSLAAFAAIAVISTCNTAPAAPASTAQVAPELPQAKRDWLNISQPVSLRQLRGKIVLLDFWTYCCINCMHVLPVLKDLERKYADDLVVIGVHSGKFTNEKDADNIRMAIARYGITHAVVNDPDYSIWNAYNIRGWPQFILIDPSGKIDSSFVGENGAGQLDARISSLVASGRRDGSLKASGARLVVDLEKPRQAGLRFPGKLIADPAAGRLFIADSGNNRIVSCDQFGNIAFVIGDGKAGLKDGAFQRCELRNPQGMALQGDKLYIADTDNHCIRLADLGKRQVSTIAGTGQQGHQRMGGPVLERALNSPWDVCLSNNKLFIAMAGFHQIWTYDLLSKRVSRWSGTGREGKIDGPDTVCTFAQPSGLTTDQTSLYVADSEASAVRKVNLASGEASTIVGIHLLVHGDVDGKQPAARLQHPLAVLWHQNRLLVADSYNHKIKIVAPAAHTSTTFLGSGKAAYVDGKNMAFNEPSGLAAINDKLFIADTNNHVIRVCDLRNKTASTLPLKFSAK